LDFGVLPAYGALPLSAAEAASSKTRCLVASMFSLSY
jgi:hypothetical protein